ncbi:MAG: tRNA epoxyqueuosine(34) reductase QueG [Hyphomicrobium sp.]|nr:tRNA epoxyqueuosine(34) reductase QueG [Hyphomicrobium sp.]
MSRNTISAASAGSPLSLERRIKGDGAQLGLDPVRIVRLADDPEQDRRLLHFLDDGRHGDMAWMAETSDRRRSPTALWSDARSAIVAGLSYAPDANPLDILHHHDRAAISVYAQRKDYHDVLKPRLKQLARTLASATGHEVKVFVDTAPLMEKPLAAKAGVGWQGKHTNLVSREHGSWLFLGAILTTAMLEPDAAEADHCGRCRKCLDICPTDAFPAPYQLDARRCIAYLTIEHKGHIPRAFRKPIGNRVFGCDDCLAVCPWNKFARASSDSGLARRAAMDGPALAELIELDDATFRTRFAGSPVKRTGRDRVVRNALIAAGNSSDAALLPLVDARLSDPSPLVRAMAVWALLRIADDEFIAQRKASFATSEIDPDVRAEWQQWNEP